MTQISSKARNNHSYPLVWFEESINSLYLIFWYFYLKLFFFSQLSDSRIKRRQPSRPFRQKKLKFTTGPSVNDGTIEGGRGSLRKRDVSWRRWGEVKKQTWRHAIWFTERNSRSVEPSFIIFISTALDFLLNCFVHEKFLLHLTFSMNLLCFKIKIYYI